MSFLFSSVSLAHENHNDNETVEIYQEKPLEKVSLQLKWLHQFQFAGFYAAKLKGFYQNEGLDVTIKPRDISQNNIQQVIDGESEYGIADSMVMLYQAKGAPLSILAAIYQHSPQVFITLKQSGIDDPFDLKNRKIAFYQKDTDGFPLLAMMHENQVSMNLERVIIKTGPDILKSGQVDAYPAYLSNEPYYFHEEGIDINIIDPKNFGIDLYGDLIFTHNDEIANHPERVEKFRKASLRGWKYALENKDELINYIINELGVNKSYEHLMFEANAIESLVKTNTTEIGEINPGRIKYIQNLFAKHNLIDSNLDLSDGIYQPQNNSLRFSIKEQAWIRRNPVVKVAIDKAWQPIEYVDNGGKLTGVSEEFLQRLSALTGIEFMAQTELNWSDAVSAVKSGDIPMFSAVIETSERNKYLNFTPAYMEFPMVVATRKGEAYIHNLNNLNNKTLAVVENYAARDLLEQQYPNINLLLVKSTQEGLEKVSNGYAYGYVDNVAVVGYQIRANGYSNLQISGETPFRADIKMAVTKELPELHSILSKALLNISPETKKQIANKWLQIEYKNTVDWQEYLYYIAPIILVLMLISFYAQKIKKLNTSLKQSNQHLMEVQKSLQSTNERLEVLSVTDFLTGAFNRKHFDTVIDQEMNRASRHNGIFSILLIDLDNFKQVNDNYGHLVGDEALKRTYQTITHQLRQSDTVGRWGGEEFIVICPETNLKQSMVLADKLLQSIEQIKFEHDFVQTVSIGIAEYQPGEVLNSLIERADKNLYQAKHQGKNRAIG